MFLQYCQEISNILQLKSEAEVATPEFTEFTIKFENADPNSIMDFLRRLDEQTKEIAGEITIVGPPELMSRLVAGD